MRSASQSNVRGKLFKKSGQRLGAGFFLLLSVILFFAGKVENASIDKARAAVASQLSPVIEFLGKPLIYAEAVGDWANHTLSIYDENNRLREENQSLLQWRSVAQDLQIINDQLNELLGVVQLEVPRLLTARVIAVSGGPYVQSVLINAGAKRGVHNGLPVVDENGLVGRVILVGEDAARVLMVSDLNSRVPVRIERTNQNAIVIGRNEGFLQLRFLPVDADIIVGDRLMTSGHGRAFPPGLFVGVVEQIDGEIINVRPSADIEHLDFVTILDFDAGLIEPATVFDQEVE